MSDAPRVLGIDPSLTGLGVCSNSGVDVIRSSGHRGDSWVQRGARIQGIVTRLLDWMIPADLIVIEGPAYSRTTGAQWDRAGLWWSIHRTATGLDIPVAVVAPTARARYATGKGNAGKDQVIAAVVRRYPGRPIDDNNAADALVLWAMGARHLGHPAEDHLPAANADAMTHVAWPDTEKVGAA